MMKLEEVKFVGWHFLRCCVTSILLLNLNWGYRSNEYKLPHFRNKRSKGILPDHLPLVEKDVVDFGSAQGARPPSSGADPFEIAEKLILQRHHSKDSNQCLTKYM